MKIWLIILVAALVSNILRIAPIYLSKLSFINHTRILNILDYAACATIGSMIYLSAFSEMKFNHLSKYNLQLIIIDITSLIITFFLSLYLRNPVKTFIICLSIYAIVLFAIPA